jgi:Icc protein
MREAPMLIAQVTDCHIGFDPNDPVEDNVQRLRAVLDQLCQGPNRPDLLLMTGDLTQGGDPASYARLAELLAPCPFPVHLLPGNWDKREALRAAFPGTDTGGDFVQFVLPLPGLRLIALDTTEPGRHGGAFCEQRAAWLSDALAADPEAPVLIAMHHPPVETGIAWLDSGADEAWIARFRSAITGHPQIRAILAGHMHRTIHTSFNGIPLIVCPATAPHVTLDLSPLDPEQPDGRPLVAAEPAGYALHRWDGACLTSHFGSAAIGEPWPILASYDASMARTVSQNARERLV